MKKFFSTLVLFFVLAPWQVFAQLSRPSSDYGLVPTTDASSFLQGVLARILAFMGSLAVLMIIASGIIYLTAGGDTNKMEKAKNWLVYAIVGLVVVLFAYVIVLFVGNALGAENSVS